MERISFNKIPDIYAAMTQVQKVVDNCGLDYKLLELMRMRVSQLNGCAYCLDMHYKEAVHAGEDVLRLVSVSAWKEAPYYTEQEQAVLEFAERLTVMSPNANNDDIHDGLSKFFGKEEIAHLTLAVTQINSWNRLVKSFGPIPGKHEVAKKTETV